MNKKGSPYKIQCKFAAIFCVNDASIIIQKYLVGSDWVWVVFKYLVCAYSNIT